MSTIHSLSLALCFAVALVRGQPDVTCLLDCPLPMTVCVIDAITGEESCEGVEFTTSTTTPAPIMNPTDPVSTDESEPDTTDMPMSTDESFDSSSGSSDSDSVEFSSTDSASGDSGDSDSDDSGDSEGSNDDDMDTDYDSESDADRTDDSDDATMNLTNDDDDADTDSDSDDSADSDSGDSSEMPMTTDSEDAMDTTEDMTATDSAEVTEEVPMIRFGADDANNADDSDADSNDTDMEMSTTDSSSGSSDSDSLEFSSTDSASGDSGDSSDSDSEDSDDFSSTMMVECVTRGLCPEGQECVINDMGEEECKEAQNAYSANESSTGEMDATATHDVVVSVVGAVGLLGLMAVAIALCCYCGRCASKEGAGSIDLGLTMAEIECEDSAGKGRTTNKETAKYGMVTQIEMDGEEELMSDHDEDLIGDHSEMIQLAMPARQTAGNITGHAMEEEL